MERLQTFWRNIFVVSIFFRTFEVENNKLKKNKGYAENDCR